MRPDTPCGHAVVEIWKDSNRNRTRCKVSCLVCERSWYGCLAKRLDDDGVEAWGPVGVQQWHDAEYEP